MPGNCAVRCCIPHLARYFKVQFSPIIIQNKTATVVANLTFWLKLKLMSVLRVSTFNSNILVETQIDFAISLANLNSRIRSWHSYFLFVKLCVP